MARTVTAACYFCGEGERAIELLEASLRRSMASGSDSSSRLQRRLRALQHTLSVHHCAAA